MMQVKNRYSETADSFRKIFPEAEKLAVYRAPGRVNLIGEHTDYNGLPVLPMAIGQDICVCASARNDNRVVIKNSEPEFEDREFTIDYKTPPYPKGDWGNYCKAAFQTLQNYLSDGKKEEKLLCGMNLLFSGNIPVGAGLSSSSAMVVAAAVAANDINNLGIDKLSLAELLSAGEKYVGTEGGGMDQTVSLSGKRGMALKIDFFPIRVKYIPFPEDYLIVVCNSLVDAKKSSGANLAYNQRVVECRLAAAMIKKFITAKYNVEPDIRLLGDLKKPEFSHMLNNIEGMLDEIFIKEELSFAEISSFLEMDEKFIRRRYLRLKDSSFFKLPPCGLKIKNRLRHVLTEGGRVEKSAECIEKREVKEFGKLMYESHKSCAEDYEISCPELDELVETARQNGAVGARLTGAGFGGCTVNLVHKRDVESFRKGMIRSYYRNRGQDNLENCIFTCEPSNGAGKIHLNSQI